jgi:hypothetical protein
MTNKFKCTCDFCIAHDKYKWAVVMKCPCSCHTSDGISGHDSLCCSIPNGLKNNNTYPDLIDSNVCESVIDEFNEKYPEE